MMKTSFYVLASLFLTASSAFGQTVSESWNPDRGIFMVKTADPRGRWKAYLSHGCPGSRAGMKSVLFVAPMSPDGTRLPGMSGIVYDGHKTQPTIGV